jgi:hypothetical protein
MRIEGESCTFERQGELLTRTAFFRGILVFVVFADGGVVAIS